MFKQILIGYYNRNGPLRELSSRWRSVQKQDFMTKAIRVCFRNNNGCHVMATRLEAWAAETLGSWI
jgi:hypothetical protein